MSRTVGEPSVPVRNAVLIAGPTASGKSAFALAVAGALGGTIVNADSMQVYSVLEKLTARPGAEELAAAPHRLYGHVHPSAYYSTGAWLRDVEALLAEGGGREGPLIFVGGTGLYFRALAGGLAEMPPVPEAVRNKWRQLLAEEGPARLHALLAEGDPATARRLDPSDGQRILRALEIHDHTGEPIGAWQNRPSRPLVDMASSRALVLLPERETLRARIDRRFEQMMEEGAIEEVRALMALRIDPSMPAMKAIGVRPLAEMIAGAKERATAIDEAKAATRQYAKRQTTWFRNQLGAEWQFVQSPPDHEKIGLLLSR